MPQFERPANANLNIDLPHLLLTCMVVGGINLWYDRVCGLVTQTIPLCSTQTSALLNHPPRSRSKSICAGQLEVQTVWEWGFCDYAPRQRLQPPACSTFTRWPTQWTCTNGISASRLCCLLQTVDRCSVGAGLECQPQRGTRWGT